MHQVHAHSTSERSQGRRRGKSNRKVVGSAPDLYSHSPRGKQNNGHKEGLGRHRVSRSHDQTRGMLCECSACTSRTLPPEVQCVRSLTMQLQCVLSGGAVSSVCGTTVAESTRSHRPTCPGRPFPLPLNPPRGVPRQRPPPKIAVPLLTETEFPHAVPTHQTTQTPQRPGRSQVGGGLKPPSLPLPLRQPPLHILHSPTPHLTEIGVSTPGTSPQRTSKR